MGHHKTTNSRPQLCDWQFKKSVLRALYGVHGDKPLVAVVLSGNGVTGNAVDLCYDSLRKWRDGSRPTGVPSTQFWEALRSDFSLSVGPTRLWTCSILEFVELLKGDPNISAAVDELIHNSPVTLDGDTRTALENRFTPKPATTLLNDYQVRGYLRMNVSGPQTGVKQGHVQHAQFYMQPEAAHAWVALVDSQNYHMYLDCLLSLKELAQSNLFADALRGDSYNAAVTLGGGGSPEKDWILATSLAAGRNSAEAVDYVINDISPFMIDLSATALIGRLHKGNLADRIQLRLDWCDFLWLDYHWTRDPTWKSVVWAILGGTIGNVEDERQFFRSIRHPSKVGDLLIVGMDTIGDETLESFEKRMETQYVCKELDALLRTSVPDPNPDCNSAPKSVAVEVVGGPNNPHSQVSGSWSVVFKREHESGVNPTILATSTRYILDDFVSFARSFGWECLGSFSAQGESTFRQLLLRRAE